MYVETRFRIGAICKPMFITDIGQHWADMCSILFQYVANMTACLILVKYSFNIAKISTRHCSYIKRTLTNLGTILGWYSHHINWLNIWNTPLSDIGMISEYNLYILANICAMFHNGWISVQYCTNVAVLLGIRCGTDRTWDVAWKCAVSSSLSIEQSEDCSTETVPRR